MNDDVDDDDDYNDGDDNDDDDDDDGDDGQTMVEESGETSSSILVGGSVCLSNWSFTFQVVVVNLSNDFFSS